MLPGVRAQEIDDRKTHDLMFGKAIRFRVGGYRRLNGEGRGTGTTWPPEESVFALDMHP